MDARMRKNGVAFASLALATLLSALPSLAQHQQDSSQQSTGDPVADAARKAREQKKKETVKPKKVYTDDDMNHSTSADAPAPDANAAAKTEDAGAKTSDAQGKDAAGKTPDPEQAAEARWRKQFKAAYTNLDRAQK